MSWKLFRQSFLLLAIAVMVSACSRSIQPSSSQEISIPAGKFYFYSASCPHCATVNAYVSEHDIKNKLYYLEREVGPDQYANSLIKAMGARCRLSEADLAVPFFWDGNTCYIGDSEVTAYFERFAK